jgi:hypothetical protein
LVIPQPVKRPQMEWLKNEDEDDDYVEEII